MWVKSTFGRLERKFEELVPIFVRRISTTSSDHHEIRRFEPKVRILHISILDATNHLCMVVGVGLVVPNSRGFLFYLQCKSELGLASSCLFDLR